MLGVLEKSRHLPDMMPTWERTAETQGRDLQPETFYLRDECAQRFEEKVQKTQRRVLEGMSM